MIDGEYALADGLAAMEYAARPGVRKILLRPGLAALDLVH